MIVKKKEIKERLIKTIGSVAKNEKMAELLGFMLKLKNQHYSLQNLLLVYSQKPDAVFLLGFKAWQRRNVKIKKGEKGIAIIAPIIKRTTVTSHDPITGEEEVTVQEKMSGFKWTHVWDVSQVDGDVQLKEDEIFVPSSREPEEFFNALKSSFRINVVSTSGKFSATKGTIAVPVYATPEKKVFYFLAGLVKIASAHITVTNLPFVQWSVAYLVMSENGIKNVPFADKFKQIVSAMSPEDILTGLNETFKVHTEVCKIF